MDQQSLNEAILKVTSGPEWKIVVQGLQSEIYASQARALSANSWEEVCRLRGFAEGIAYISNLREITKQAMDSSNADV